MVPATSTADAVVIGGGIIGCSIALELARRGRRVRVLDKGPDAGSGSTSASSAVVRFNFSTTAGVATAWEAKHLWSRWEELIDGADEGGLARFHQVGMLLLDPPEDTRRSSALALFDQVGVPYEELSADEVIARYPAVDNGRFWPPRAVEDELFWATSHGRLDAYVTPDAGFVDDPRLAAHNLMAAARRHGASFTFRTEVVGIRSGGDRVTGVALGDGTVLSAPVVVNAAGPYSARVNGLAGVLDDFATVTTRPLRQEVHALPAPAGFSSEAGGTVVMDADLGTYLRPHPGGTILVGGLEPECDGLEWITDPDAFSESPTVARWQAQTWRAARRLPDVRLPSRPRGVGALYDVTPDWTPIYDRTSLDGFYVAIGTSGNQFKNAPIVGQLLARIVEACEGGVDVDRHPLAFDCALTSNTIDLGTYSRRRRITDTAANVLG